MDIASESAYHTTKIEMIRSFLRARKRGDKSQFLRDIDALNVPLVTVSDEKNDDRIVTFIWHAEKPLQAVYVRLNRVTDKQDVETGMMIYNPSNNIWWLTLSLPATYRGSYTIVEIPAGTSPANIALAGSRFSPFHGKFDPLNTRARINVRGFEESILALDQAPAQREWECTPRISCGETVSSYHVIAGQMRRVRLFIPDISRNIALGLLVLPDAETWFDNIGIINAINIAMANHRVRPLAILGIDNLDEQDRLNVLGGNQQFVSDIARCLIPGLKKENPGIKWAGKMQTYLAGQSLGGITALMAARDASEVFGHVISHSPSVWWKPGNDSRPNQFSENDASWVCDYLLAAPPLHVKIHLGVGSLEGATVPHLQKLHQQLLNKGAKSELTIYTGGHDYAWWRGALIDGLSRDTLPCD